VRILVGLPVIALALVTCTAQAASTSWNCGEGLWNETQRWKPSRPDRKTICQVRGKSRVSLLQGEAFAGSLDVGLSRDDDSRLIIDGGELTVLLGLRMGEYTGSTGLLELKSGVIHAANVYVGSANYYDAGANRSTGTFRISGGSLDCRLICLGMGQGSQATLEIVGSRASRIDVLDFVSLGTAPFKLERPSTTALSFTLDSRGVTPIVIHHDGGGLQLYASGPANRRDLRIRLLAAPPREDILLVSTRRTIQGTFTGLPEGTPIRAAYAGKTYQWMLSYRGGPEEHDLVLTAPAMVRPDGRVVPLTAGRTVTRPRPPAVTASLPPVQVLPDDNAPPGKVFAFPGAEGYGAYTPGGRGGKILAVTNLADSGPGSFRAAVQTKGPRTVIFRTGGVIQLKSSVNIAEPYLTIAGQTAPGDGICIRGGEIVLDNTHDVIIRHLRLRPGRIPGQEIDCLRAHSSEDFIIDHVSMSWSSDKAIVPTEFSDRYTVQWCLIAESTNHKHHAFAMIVGGIHSTWHHNLLADHVSRNPRLSQIARCDWRNNVIYNWGHTSAYGEFTWLNYVNNYFKPGPSTTQKPPLFYRGDCTVAAQSLYAAGNVMEGFWELSEDNWKGIKFDPAVRAVRSFDCPKVQTQPAPDAYEAVLAGAGATVPGRDPVDRRVVGDVRTGHGHIIDHENDVGGYPPYVAGTPPMDSDGDGIPDDWELAHGLNPQDPSDANVVGENSGYTNLERYLNSLAQPCPAGYPSSPKTAFRP